MKDNIFIPIDELFYITLSSTNLNYFVDVYYECSDIIKNDSKNKFKKIKRRANTCYNKCFKNLDYLDNVDNLIGLNTFLKIHKDNDEYEMCEFFNIIIDKINKDVR